MDTAPQQTRKKRQKYKGEVDQCCQAGAAIREGNIPSISRPIPPGIPSGLWQDTHGRQHTHSRQLPPEAARWLRNTSCLRLPAQDTARDIARVGIWEPTSLEGSRPAGQCWVLDPRDGASLPAGPGQGGCWLLFSP